MRTRINAETISLAMTLIIAAGAFVWSFAALNELAVMAGQHRALAWIGPVFVDGAIIHVERDVLADRIHTYADLIASAGYADRNPDDQARYAQNVTDLRRTSPPWPAGRGSTRSNATKSAPPSPTSTPAPTTSPNCCSPTTAPHATATVPTSPRTPPLASPVPSSTSTRSSPTPASTTRRRTRSRTPCKKRDSLRAR